MSGCNDAVSQVWKLSSVGRESRSSGAGFGLALVQEFSTCTLSPFGKVLVASCLDLSVSVSSSGLTSLKIGCKWG